MTRDETAKIIFILMSTFSAAYKSQNSAKTNALIQAWNAVMEDYTYSEVEQGLYIYMSTDTSGFPPSPGQVIDKIRAARPQEREIDALEAWAIVEKAVSNSAYNSAEEFAKLPELCQKAIGNHQTLKEWATMDIDKFQTVEQSHFIRVYDTVKKRQKEHDRLPEKVKTALGVAETPFRLPEKEPEPERIRHKRDISAMVDDLERELEKERAIV